MKKLALAGIIALVAVLGATAFTARSNTASAQTVQAGRVSINCSQVTVPTEPNNWVGMVQCDITVKMPPPTADIKGTLNVYYRDRDHNGRPDIRDRIICWTIDIFGRHKSTCPAT